MSSDNDGTDRENDNSTHPPSTLTQSEAAIASLFGSEAETLESQLFGDDEDFNDNDNTKADVRDDVAPTPPPTSEPDTRNDTRDRDGDGDGEGDGDAGMDVDEELEREAAAIRKKKEKDLGNAKAEGTPVTIHSFWGKTPTDGKLSLFRLPNVLNIETKPFDQKTYVPVSFADTPKDKDKDKDTDKKKPRDPHLLLSNVIRYRHRIDEFGLDRIESNARVIEWSNGSKQLWVGSEVFEIVERKVDKTRNYLFHLNSGRTDAEIKTRRRIRQKKEREEAKKKKMGEREKEKKDGEGERGGKDEHGASDGDEEEDDDEDGNWDGNDNEGEDESENSMADDGTEGDSMGDTNEFGDSSVQRKPTREKLKQRGRFRMAVGQFQSHLNFRVLSIESQSHSALKAAVAAEHAKAPKIKRQFENIDAVKMKLEMEALAKAEEAKQRARERKEEMARLGGYDGGRSRSISKQWLEGGGSDEEDDDEGETEGRSAMKRRMDSSALRSRLRAAKGYEEDEDDGFIVNDDGDGERERNDSNAGEGKKKKGRTALSNEDREREETEKESSSASAAPHPTVHEEEDFVVKKTDRSKRRQLADDNDDNED